jgi:hypothetical protein
MAEGRYIGNPAFRVHTQSGQMANALSGKLISSTRYRVEIDKTRAPHAVDVIRGTKVMLPRDVVWSTAQGKSTKKEIMRTIVKFLGKGLRSQAVVRFAPSQDGSGSRRIVIVAMNNKKLDMEKATTMAVAVGGATLHALVRKNITLNDHTLDDLAKMDHPYARRHGKIKIHNRGG